MRTPYSILFLMLTSLLTVVSCSQKGSNVKLEISNNFIFGGTETQSVSSGGLMVWGHNTTGANFGQAVENNDSINLQLPNGSWTFYAMSWDGTKDYADAVSTNKIFGGTINCAKASTLLGGESAIVDLKLNNANCADTVFTGAVPTSGSAGDIQLAKTKFNFCNGLDSTLTNPTQVCADSKIDPRKAFGKAPVTSFRVKMRNHFSLGGDRKLLAGGITSECIEMKGDLEGSPSGTTSDPTVYGGSQILVPGLPAGGPNLPFHMTVEMFLGTPDCDASAGSRGLIARELPSGISSMLMPSNKYMPHSGVMNTHRQYIAVPANAICDGRRETNLGTHAFAAGDGTKEHPYIICSVPQFHAINDSSNHYSQHFKLQANLDFNPYSKGLSTAATTTAIPNCLEDGTNFTPIGYSSITCAGNIATWPTATPFTGSFNGASFALKNLRLRAEEQDQIGIFARITESADVGNFQIEKAEISGKSIVGSVAGSVQGAANSDSIHIWSIKGSMLDIESRLETTNSNTGGIVGNLVNGKISNVIIKDSKIRGRASQVGGVIGNSTNAQLTQVSVEADIDSNSPSVIVDIGGLIGRADNTILKFVKHEGGIYTNAKQVGGIAGSIHNSSELSDFYTISNVVTNDSDVSPKIGGVVGWWNAAAASTIGPGYTLSQVRAGCTGSCTHGPVVGSVTTQPSNQTTIYKMNSDSTGEGSAPATFTTAEVPYALLSIRANATTSNLADANTSDWAKTDGQYPRFDFESHPCTGTGLGMSGAGTLLNPYKICNETQYATINNAVTGTHYQLLSNIRLKNVEVTANDITTFNGVLLGNGKALIGGNSSMTSGGSLGHIGTLGASGVIRNLKIHGMGRKSTAMSSLATAHGVFVARNYGRLEDINVRTTSSFLDFGSGFVGVNYPTGVMKKIRFDGKVEGNNSLSPIVVSNQGIIEDSKINGEMRCKTSICSFFSGLAITNTGTIRRTEMAARVSEDNGNLAGQVSMLTNENNGLLEDIFIPGYAEFRIGSSGGYYFNRTNGPSGILRRVMNLGKLLHANNSYAATMTDFPTIASSINTGSGTYNGVYRSGGRSGKELIRDASFSCSSISNNEIYIPSFNSSADFSTWNSSYYMNYNAAADAQKRLVIDYKFDDGTSYTHRVSNFDWANYKFTIPTTHCPSGKSGNATVYYTDDLAISISTGSAMTGAMPPQFIGVTANYDAIWSGFIWTPADQQDKMNYYAYSMGISSTPVTPKTWELDSDGELRLFNDHD